MCNACSTKSNFLDGLDGYSLDDAKVGSPSPHAVVAKKEEERHPCFECNGTGIYKGVRLHQEKDHCFACKGKGWFKKSFAGRQKAKQKAHDRKKRALAAKQEAFTDANEGLIDALKEIAGWHQFAGKLIEDFKHYGGLTENQTTAAKASLAKVAAKRAERIAERAAKSGDVSVEAIEKLFATAKSNGLKRPRFITERLKISLAPATGRNAGAIYVQADGAYAGKIVSGKFLALKEAPADTLDLLRTIAASPVEAATAYGKATGVCACCGRELTDPASISAGIGPVCAEKWF